MPDLGSHAGFGQPCRIWAAMPDLGSHAGFGQPCRIWAATPFQCVPSCPFPLPIQLTTSRAPAALYTEATGRPP
eukprot:scaffold9904_cov100-Isochrysis_galbana.AAC.3